MSNVLEQVVGKAVLDAAFREALVANPEAAVAEAGFKLDKEQLEQLHAGLERYKQDSAAQELLSTTGAKTESVQSFWRS